MIRSAWEDRRCGEIVELVDILFKGSKLTRGFLGAVVSERCANAGPARRIDFGSKLGGIVPSFGVSDDRSAAARRNRFGGDCTEPARPADDQGGSSCELVRGDERRDRVHRRRLHGRPAHEGRDRPDRPPPRTFIPIMRYCW